MITVDSDSIANILANTLISKAEKDTQYFKSFCEKDSDNLTLVGITQLALQYAIQQKILSGQLLEKHWEYLSEKYPSAIVDRYINFTKELTDKHPEFVGKYIREFIMKNDVHVSYIKWLCVNNKWSILNEVNEIQTFPKPIRKYIESHLKKANRSSIEFNDYTKRISTTEVVFYLESDIKAFANEKDVEYVYCEPVICIEERIKDKPDDDTAEWLTISELYYYIRKLDKQEWYDAWKHIATKFKLKKFDLEFDITFNGKIDFEIK